WIRRPRRRSHPCWCPRSHCAETIAALPAAPRHAWRGPWDARDPEQEFSRSTYLANTGLVSSLFILYSPAHLFQPDSGTRPCTAILLLLPSLPFSSRCWQPAAIHRRGTSNPARHWSPSPSPPAPRYSATPERCGPATNPNWRSASAARSPGAWWRSVIG